MKKIILSALVVIICVVFFYPKTSRTAFYLNSPTPKCFGILKYDMSAEQIPGSSTYVCYGILY